jgi:hypothetical protein
MHGQTPDESDSRERRKYRMPTVEMRIGSPSAGCKKGKPRPPSGSGGLLVSDSNVEAGVSQPVWNTLTSDL